ncbi:Suppressor of glycerol defect protein 1 [Podosphaera aphanis]|nr:Suppressor of glycerol defect protein 1 [Podosphaera aphanis]
MAPQQGTLKLPKVILDQLGAQYSQTQSKSRSRPSTRKELRKIARQKIKPLKQNPPPKKHNTLPKESTYSINSATQPTHNHSPRKAESESSTRADSVSKKRKLSTSPSPPRLSKAVLDRLAEDDKEIAALEKKLKIKGSKKLPKSFRDDGLDVLLEDLNETDNTEVENRKNEKAVGEEWLRRKRVKAQDLLVENPRSNDQHQEDVKSSKDSDSEIEDSSNSECDRNTPETDSFCDFESEKSFERNRQRENPYVAPTSSAAQKYIPPSLRNTKPSDSEELVRLRRRTQGLINRLTESNLISILGDIEGLYRGNPRGHVTSILTDILLVSVSEPTSLPDTLIILPAGLIAAIYKVIGTDFGAQIVQRIVELLGEHYSRATELYSKKSDPTRVENSKETSNLVMLLAELFNFQVVASNLIFDYIRLFLSELSELNAELLLKIIRTSGPQLRQEDPSSLNDIVAMLRPAMAKIGEDKISVRTKFMIETIEKLKNNRIKTGLAASAVTSEHTIRMKKILGSLNNRSLKATEPLRLGLKDISESDKKGKWWLVGASWSGNSKAETNDTEYDNDEDNMSHFHDSGALDLLQLAREQRMNTDIRRAIFVTIMSATDFQDAYARLMKLKLKKAQEYQIPKVLLRCAAMEKTYNPYYTLVAQKICGDKKLKVSFQYCLWDLFKQMGESEEADTEMEEEECLDTRHIVNIAKMFSSLIAEGILGLSVLKNLNLGHLQPKTSMFVEVLLITIILQSKEDEKLVTSIFFTAHGISHLITGLQYFLKKVVRKTDLAEGKQAKKTIKWACTVAIDTLQRLVDINS